MKDFNHPHIMSLIGVCLDTSLGVVMPFMANGSVLSYLKREKEALLLSDETDIEEVGIIYNVSLHASKIGKMAVP